MFFNKTSNLKRRSKVEFNLLSRKLKLYRLNNRSWFTSLIKSRYPILIMFIIVVLTIIFPLTRIDMLDIIPLNLDMDTNNFTNRLANTLVLFSIVFTMIGIALSSLSRKDRIVFQVLSDESHMHLAIYSIYVTSIYNLVFAIFIHNIPPYYLYKMMLASTYLFVFTLSLAVICFYKIFTVIRLDNYYRFVSKALLYECYVIFIKQLKSAVSKKIYTIFLLENKLASSNLLYHYKMESFTFRDLTNLDNLDADKNVVILTDIKLEHLKRIIRKEYIDKNKRFEMNKLGLGIQNNYETVLWCESKPQNQLLQLQLKKIIKVKKVKSLDNFENISTHYLLSELSSSVKNHEMQVLTNILDIVYGIYRAYNPVVKELSLNQFYIEVDIIKEFESSFYNVFIMSVDSYSYDIQRIIRNYLYKTTILHFITWNVNSLIRYITYYGYLASLMKNRSLSVDERIDYFQDNFTSYIRNFRFLIQSISSHMKKYDEEELKNKLSVYCHLYNNFANICLDCINDGEDDQIEISISELGNSDPKYYFEHDEIDNEIRLLQMDVETNMQILNIIRDRMEIYKRPLINWLYSIKALQYWAILLSILEKVSKDKMICVFKSCEANLKHSSINNLYSIYCMIKESRDEDFTWNSWDYEKRNTNLTYTPPSPDLWIKSGVIYELIINGHYNIVFEEDIPEKDVIHYVTFLEEIHLVMYKKKVDYQFLEELLKCSSSTITIKVELVEQLLHRDIEQFKKKYYLQIAQNIIKLIR